MKKIITILFLIFILSSCSTKDAVSKSIYIASIGFEHNDDGYTGYFLCTSSVDVGQQKKGNESSVAKISGDGIIDIFNKFYESSSLILNYKHISTIILDISMLEPDIINSFIDFFIKSNSVDFNFHIFVTDEDINEIFKVKNPNNESSILSIIIEPIYSEYSYYTAKPIHFLNFSRDYYNNKTIHIPYIELSDIWDEEKSLMASGLLFYDEGKKSLLKSNNDFIFLKSFNKLEYNRDNLAVIFTDYKVNIDYKSNKIKITSFYEVINEDISNEELEKYIKNKINEMIDKLSFVDFLNINYYNKKYEELSISINLNKK